VIENNTAGNLGGRLVFTTATNGSLTEKMRITSAGNVGIGTSSIGERLSVIGNGLFGNITTHTPLYSTFDSQQNQFLEIGSGTSHSDITPYPALILSNNTTSTSNTSGIIGQVVFANRSIADGSDKRTAIITSWVDGASNSGTLQFYTNSAGTLAERMRVTSTGNIGIGTTNPLGTLHTKGQFVFFDDSSGGISGGLYANSVSSSAFTLWSGAGDFRIGTGVTDRNIGTGFTERIRILNSNGNVGVGISAPNYKLDVNGEINATGVRINGNPISGGSQWVGSNSIYYNSGNVAIGTNNPLALFDVRNSDGMFYAGFGYGANKETFLRAGNSTVGVMHIGDVNTSKTLLQEGGGNVGIGTSAPEERLHVVGNIKVTGNINAKYQDVAEWVPSAEQLTAGTVVVLDVSKSNQVTSSTTAYDTRVAGVVSIQPGITLGEKSEDKVLVATTGRVRVKVDASRTPINIGDLLVTSDIPGIAMKSEAVNLGGVQIHRPGTIIGKALEPLAKGQGEILVLLSLQ
jgi:hypothetical protein